MARKKPGKTPELLSLGEYLGPEFFNELERAERFAHPQSLAEIIEFLPDGDKYELDFEHVRKWWPFRFLRSVAERGDAETYKRCLEVILIYLHANPPKGVLREPRLTRGRPKEAEHVYLFWCAENKPILNARICDQIAKASYPDEFDLARKDLQLRKKLRDRIRATIQRYDQRRKPNAF